ncbi:MAG: acyl-CoA/acyl-ACP dehydrogenase [Thaumarchaeota archaeon]|nr:acyl-CoA/acyl-ACP dehydrogenase [Nitrososphaerota archaeon]
MGNREQILKDVNDFCEKLRPIEDVCYLEHKFNDQIIPLAKEFNILGLPVPEEFNGRGADNFTFIKALERIGMEGSGVRSVFSVHSSLAQKTLMKFGRDEQKERYLKPSAKGEIILAFALTEPDAGSNPLELKMNYKKDGDSYILNGTKYLITNAGIADAIIVFAKSINNEMSAFIIDTNREGIEREDLVSKMGTPTTNTGMFELRDYRVSKENIIGKESDGWQIAKQVLIDGRLGVAAGCTGSIKDCLIEAVKYSKERIQYGKPIAKHQLIQEHLTAIKIHLSSSSMMVRRATMFKDKWDKNPDDKELMRRADLAVAEAKLFCTKSACDAADGAVQILGGRGWSFLYRPGRHLVDNRVCRIYEGSDEIMKLKIAAGILGKEYRSYS